FFRRRRRVAHGGYPGWTTSSRSQTNGCSSSTRRAAASRMRIQTTAPKLVLRPAIQHVRDAHHVDIYSCPATGVDVEIAAAQLPRGDTSQASFLLCLANRRIAWSFTLIE